MLQHIAIKPHRRFLLDYAHFGKSSQGFPRSTVKMMLEIRLTLRSLRCVRLITEGLDLENFESEVGTVAGTSVVLTEASDFATKYKTREPREEHIKVFHIKHCFEFLTILKAACIELSLRLFRRSIDESGPRKNEILKLAHEVVLESSYAKYQRVPIE